MPFLKKTVSLETYSETEFKITEPVKYEGKCGVHIVPAGTVTDFASVPPMVQWLIPSYGLYALAAVVHDFYCVMLRDFIQMTAAQFLAKYGIDKPPISSRDVDAMFRRMMRELGVPFIRRWVMWTGVRWGAMFSRYRRKGILPDLFLMMVWSILATPIVLPASILAGIGLAIDRLVEKLIGLFHK